jgi:hypothetical protein
MEATTSIDDYASVATRCSRSNADTVEGDPCYEDLKSIPGDVEAVVTATRPEIAEATMREYVALRSGRGLAVGTRRFGRRVESRSSWERR